VAVAVAVVVAVVVVARVALLQPQCHP